MLGTLLLLLKTDSWTLVNALRRSHISKIVNLCRQCQLLFTLAVGCN